MVNGSQRGAALCRPDSKEDGTVITEQDIQEHALRLGLTETSINNIRRTAPLAQPGARITYDYRQQWAKWQIDGQLGAVWDVMEILLLKGNLRELQRGRLLVYEVIA